MAKFITVTPASSGVKTIVNVDQILFIERSYTEKGYNRDMTKIFFNDKEPLIVEDTLEKLTTRMNEG